ncbi:MAG: hypothetical protein IKX85_00450, partial [Clostridia bacterium]|nr:hypothetical protein [Clostridia bacterium]
GEIRAGTRDAALPFVEAQIGPCSLPQTANPDSCRYWHGIKELQRKLPAWLPRTATVPTTGASLQDMIHLDAASQEELGNRMAEEMFRLITGKGAGVPALSRVETFPHPVKRGFSVVAATFRNLIGELTCAGRPYGFSVTVDDQVPWEYPNRYLSEIRLGGDRVLVTVEDDYVPLDRAYLWYGAGCGTVCTVTDGAGRALPAFGPVRIR